MSEHTLLTSGTGDSSLSPDALQDEPDFRAKPSRKLEITIAAIALALSALAFYFSYNIKLMMDPGGINARWWPNVLSLSAAGLSTILLITSLTVSEIDRGDVEEANAEGWSRMLKALALSSLYVFAWSKIGYLIPTIVYLIALLWIFGLRGRIALLAFPLITTFFIYGLFHYMLRVPL
jgi:hypothetical protein